MPRRYVALRSALAVIWVALSFAGCSRKAVEPEAETAPSRAESPKPSPPAVQVPDAGPAAPARQTPQAAPPTTMPDVAESRQQQEKREERQRSQQQSQQRARRAEEHEAPARAFPWPPPTASAMCIVPRPLLTRVGVTPARLREIDRTLSNALDLTGYVEKSYYSVPGGFALVTRLEQIETDGASKPAPDRWSVEAARLTRFSLSGYLYALLTAKPGYYRVIVFVVSEVPFSQQDRHVTGEEAVEWLSHGLNALPESIGQQGYSEASVCTALIYEFQRRQGMPDILVPSRFDGLTHLRKAGLWAALGGS